MTAQGLMFHHFHGAGHSVGQGSLSALEFEELLEYVGLERILPARDWLQGMLDESLPADAVCLTFDDGLLCQYEVALRVLQSFDLTAFFFVYSSVFEGNLENLDVYRKFRDTCFGSIDEFYGAFDRALTGREFGKRIEDSLAGFIAGDYLAECPFYSEADRRFRYLRDKVLGPADYQHVMDTMIAKEGFSSLMLAENLWMSDEHLRQLHENGHVLGLHSYSHPTQLSSLNVDDQREEYSRNFEHLKKITGVVPSCMAHPCNSYNSDTLRILTELGIRLGFCSNLRGGGTALEIPREDHANLVKAMKNTQ